MSAELGYDTTHLRALQEELRRLNAAAIESGVLANHDRPAGAAPASPPPMPKGKTARNRGKAAAGRLLSMAGRTEDDESPDVPGTTFTEAGVVRLLAHLRRRRGRKEPWQRFLQRMQRGLSRPVSYGQHTIAGISLARLQVVSNQLTQIQTHGLARLEARRAVRQDRLSQVDALMLGGRPQAAEPAPSIGQTP